MPYWLKRIIMVIPLVLGITFVSFFIMQVSPGDPATMFMDPNSSPEDLEQLRRNFGLDQPISIQYYEWLKRLCVGDFGFSYVSGKSVLVLISERLPATLLLSIVSMIAVLVITFPLGLISGSRKGSWFDHWVTMGSFIGMSVPSFWMGLILILWLSLSWDIFPTSGYLDPSLTDAGWWEKMTNISHHMVLPLITTIVGSLAGLTRFHRFGIISILSKDYIKAARARGISEKRILYIHAFKNSALPIVTILGLQIPGLISGSFIIETIFAWPGLGQLGVTAVFARDYPVLMGTLFFSSILIIIGNLMADLGYHYIDPRISRK